MPVSFYRVWCSDKARTVKIIAASNQLRKHTAKGGTETNDRNEISVLFSGEHKCL